LDDIDGRMNPPVIQSRQENIGETGAGTITMAFIGAGGGASASMNCSTPDRQQRVT